MRVLERVQREGKTVKSFISWCGGLPEPSASNVSPITRSRSMMAGSIVDLIIIQVPLGYKFSWSPKAVLTAALNSASYKLNGRIHHVKGDELLVNHFPDVPLWKGLALEGLANRDSLPYAEKYGMGSVEGMIHLFRGTLRYKGFSTLMDSFRKIGLLGNERLRRPVESWADFLPAVLQHSVQHDRELKRGDVASALDDVLGKNRDEVVEAMTWYVTPFVGVEPR